MLKACAIVLCCLTLSACASRPSCPEIPATPPRAQPVEAMGPSSPQSVLEACRFRPQFSNLTLDEQGAMLRNCFEVLGPAYREEARKRSRLVEWINQSDE